MVTKVNWQAVWQNDHKVEPPVEAGQGWFSSHPAFSCTADAPPVFLRHGLLTQPAGSAGLDLDKGDLAATSRNEVNFADGQAHAPGQDAVAFQA